VEELLRLLGSLRRSWAALVTYGKHSESERDGLQLPVLNLSCKERIVNPLVLILVVILIVSLLGGGYGLRSGNTILGAGGGLIGLILLILLILALMGRL